MRVTRRIFLGVIYLAAVVLMIVAVVDIVRGDYSPATWTALVVGLLLAILGLPLGCDSSIDGYSPLFDENVNRNAVYDDTEC
ncbi:hypothetical protein C6V83_16805 [Gordonia iterans]|uniref:Uncharacterized protein n=1 Tax=Gordonia iterans TaxID=1004901 RepID=A0A2S0KJ09_9ACTN|nr:hypothetical protein [Gordonia iterans]AVM01669.1 hypothetical protein C6V83_16805 [Gordonia iterans]